MSENKEPIQLTAKSRRNLYLTHREQIEAGTPELLPDFDRLHALKHQEFPRLHEFRLGWLCGREFEATNPLLRKESLFDNSVLVASARINELEDLLRALSPGNPSEAVTLKEKK